MATKSDGPRPKGDTIVTVGLDLRQHPGRPASGRPSPVIARYEAIRVGARRAGESKDPGRPASGRLSPEGATDNKQAVSTPADIGYASIG